MDEDADKVMQQLAKNARRLAEEDTIISRALGDIVRRLFRGTDTISISDVIAELEKTIAASPSMTKGKAPDLDVERMRAEATITILKALR